MIELGKINKLTVSALEEGGYTLLCSEKSDEVFLPQSKTKVKHTVGEEIEVFVYIDDKDLPIATTEKPKGEVGSFCFMKVVGLTDFGAFVDMGIQKHLLVPVKHQKRRFVMGEEYLVYIGLDEQTGKLFGSTKLGNYLEFSVVDLHRNQKVMMLPYDESELGVSVVIEQKYQGMLYTNEIFSKVQLGVEVQGFVKAVRPDRLVDVSLQPVGMTNANHSMDIIIKALEVAGGFLGLHDKSQPEDIKSQLGMSKQNFKRAIGMLYKAGKIDLLKDGIKSKLT